MHVFNCLSVHLCLLITCVPTTFAFRGIISLDSLTLDKVLHRFPTTLVKFDIQYPYREVQIEVEHIAQGIRNIPDLVIGEIYIQDYGDYENQDLGQRFNISKSEFPLMFLFKRNDLKNPIRFPPQNEFKAYKIKQFIKQYTGYYIPQENSIEEFDEFVDVFMAPETTKSTKEKLLSDAVQKAQSMDGDVRKSADIYIHLMRKVLERGNLFIASEEERIKNILKSKITMETGRAMLLRQRIIQNFITEEIVSFPKTEL